MAAGSQETGSFAMKPRFEGKRLMFRRTVSFLFLALTLASAPSADKRVPMRLASTAREIAGVVYALGLCGSFVDVDRVNRYPLEAQRNPLIGVYAAPNVGAIAALRPTLVISSANPVQLRQRL